MVQVVKEATSEYGYFIQTILSMVTKRMGKEYTVSIYKVMKNNSLELDSLVLLKEGRSFAPNIYLQPYYEAYKQGTSLPELADRLCRIYMEYQVPVIEGEFSYTFEEMKQYIIYRLVSYERNKKLLEKVPHIRYLDLAITYHCLVRDDKDGIGTIRITNEHMRLWKIGMKDIHDHAAENTMSLFPPVIKDMEEMILGMISEEGGENPTAPLHEETSASFLFNDNILMKSNMYILTNEKGINGASCILYPDVLQKFADRFYSDFYIFPSSIHEVILTPTADWSKGSNYALMVKEINETQVAPEEILSDHVYFYSRKSGLMILE